MGKLNPCSVQFCIFRLFIFKHFMANGLELVKSPFGTPAAQGEERRQRRDQREADELPSVAFRV